MPNNHFVALLRGVNVGGKGLVSMAVLKKNFEKAGFTDVATYINSGNVIFRSKEANARKIEETIDRLLASAHKLNGRTVVKSFSEMEKIIKNLPKSWNGSKMRRYYVMFLRHSIDSKKILKELKPRKGIEELDYVPGALLWSAKISGLTKSWVAKVISMPMYKEMTMRNINTTKKLYDLMKIRP